MATRVPVGLVIAYAFNSTPSGWLLCNGDTINLTGSVQGVPAAELQTLRNFLGTTYGAQGQLPDLRGRFIRGAGDDGSEGMKPAAFGDKQGDSIRKHAHSQVIRRLGNCANGSSAFTGTNETLAPSTDPAGPGPENRPHNIALRWCIKY